MAIYEYECEECGTVIEVEQKITQPILPSVVCPDCSGCANKIVSKNNFKLKGEGWPSKDLKRGID